MISIIKVSTNTYFIWQTVLAILTVISTLISFWRMRQGTNKDEMTYFRDEVMNSLKDIKNDIENTSDRLDAHLDRQSRHSR